MVNLEKQDRKNKVTSSVLTMTIGGTLLLLLFVFSLKAPALPDEQEGMIIDFGYSDTGTGIEESTVNATPPPPPPQKVSKQEEVVTQDVEDAPVIKTEKKQEKKVKTPVQTQPQTQQVKIDPNQTFKGFKNTPVKGSSSDGPGNGPGNFGKPDGDPNGGLGGEGNNPYGKGVGYSLDGRSMVSRPNIDGTPPEPGKVVLKISVNQNGVVTSATYERKGSTIVDQGTINKAINSVKNKRLFDQKSDAPEIQEGYITINYSFN